MLTTGETYRDVAGDYFIRQNPDRTTRRLIRQLEALGHQVTLAPLEREPRRSPDGISVENGGGERWPLMGRKPWPPVRRISGRP
jgi:hypothetical protein